MSNLTIKTVNKAKTVNKPKAKAKAKAETKEILKKQVKTVSHEQFLKLKESSTKIGFNIKSLETVLTSSKESNSKYALNIKTMSKSEQKTHRESIRKNFLKISNLISLEEYKDKKIAYNDKFMKDIETMFLNYCKVFLCTDKNNITKDFILNTVYCAIGANKDDVNSTKKWLINNLSFMKSKEVKEVKELKKIN